MTFPDCIQNQNVQTNFSRIFKYQNSSTTLQHFDLLLFSSGNQKLGRCLQNAVDIRLVRIDDSATTICVKEFVTSRDCDGS